MDRVTGIQTQQPTSATTATPAATPIAASIPPDRARSLARWNRVLSGLHGLQFVAMLAVASTAAAFAPYLSTVSIMTVDGVFAGLEPTQVQLFSMPLAWFIASFLAISAIAHFIAGWPLRRRYEAWLARGMNPLRWVEYAFSSTVMIERYTNNSITMITVNVSASIIRMLRSPAMC